nr:hypothetical protein Iba_chr04fCG14300 [Ipomoea batatas]
MAVHAGEEDPGRRSPVCCSSRRPATSGEESGVASGRLSTGKRGRQRGGDCRLVLLGVVAASPHVAAQFAVIYTQHHLRLLLPHVLAVVNHRRNGSQSTRGEGGKTAAAHATTIRRSVVVGLSRREGSSHQAHRWIASHVATTLLNLSISEELLVTLHYSKHGASGEKVNGEAAAVVGETLEEIEIIIPLSFHQQASI